ncbi:MAG: hypothetical protein ABJF65_00175 [Reichenbachiella sp.]|uniref:hypothetical protein n=1 Tax=Reichenbachiella sp. TaxID=2184521 RepID=UPI0032658142
MIDLSGNFKKGDRVEYFVGTDIYIGIVQYSKSSLVVKPKSENKIYIIERLNGSIDEVTSKDMALK